MLSFMAGNSISTTCLMMTLKWWFSTGELWKTVEAFLVVTIIERECYWHLVGRTRGLDILKVQNSLLQQDCATSGTIFKCSNKMFTWVRNRFIIIWILFHFIYQEKCFLVFFCSLIQNNNSFSRNVSNNCVNQEKN